MFMVAVVVSLYLMSERLGYLRQFPIQGSMLELKVQLDAFRREGYLKREKRIDILHALRVVRLLETSS